MLIPRKKNKQKQYLTNKSKFICVQLTVNGNQTFGLVFYIVLFGDLNCVKTCS